ncbi:MAG: DPP IV N-terminal domain-containing protein [Bacteroidales bacterium]|nr:DPP IV N-terminal domain-containing protein [Bacteroidales bacterium]
MKKISLILFILSLPVILFSQEKKLSIEDASYMNRSIMAESLSGLSWMGSTDFFTYNEENEIMASKATEEKPFKLLSIDDINAVLNEMGKDSLKRLPRITWKDDKLGYFTAGKTVYTYDVKSMVLSEKNHYPDEAANIDLETNTYALAYTKDNNLFVSLEGKEEQLTNDSDPGIINGQTVHRNEFGISGGTFWSLAGKYLAFYRKDERMVSDYPLVDIDARVAEPDNIKYPMAGMKSHHVTLGVYDVGSGNIVFLETGEPAEQYLTCVSWGPEEKYIYIALLNRDQNHMKMNKYDVQTGKLVKTLFEEKNEHYVEPEDDLTFLHTNNNEFIWISERDGYRHLYLFNTEGEMIKQLTSGKWVVRNFLGLGPKDRFAYFTSTKESPLNSDVYSVNLKNGEISNISIQNGTHHAVMNKNGKYYFDIFNDTLTARKYAVVSTKGKLMQILKESKDPLADYATGKLSVFSIEAGDGTELYCSMITPPGFDPAKKYPVLIYVYGGPHAQLVTNSWMGGASLFLYYMAQEGYIVFTLDNRGSAHRGRDFEQAIHRRMGTIEVEDQARGVEYLKSLPYVDADRIGVNGWSYGGFMTISLMLKQAGDFKVGVCGGPVTDWKYYEIMYGERYMDTPESNPEGYEEASLLNHADKLKGDLLIIHGTSDPVVVWQHSLALINRFIKKGKQVDYFVYPGHGHGVGGRDRVHLNAKMAKYFKDHL